MSEFYRIKGLPGLSGLIVEAQYSQPLLPDWVTVDAIHSPNMVIGDRGLSYPLPEAALMIHEQFLVPAEDPRREYTTTNPFETQLYEGRFTKDGIEIVTVEYKNAYSITIIEKNPPEKKGLDKTLYSQNFFRGKRQTAKELVEQVLVGTWDVHDLIFELQELSNHPEED